MNKDKKKQSKLFVIYGIIVTIIIGIFAISPFKISNIMTNSKKVNAAGDIPAHEKTRTSNNDGTYKISLSVTGDVTKKPNKANVIVILDSSGSMNNRTGGTGSIRRLAAAKNAVNSLANNLLAYNSKEGYPADTIQMALVDFDNHANQVGNITTSASTFNGYVNGLTSGGGTNWEAALSTANSISFGDDDQTYVIFVSDGNPTFRDTQNGWNDWSGGEYQAWGSGQETSQNITRCYTTALPKAQEIVTAGKKFYTIGAYGDVDRMQSLTTEAGAPAGNYYSAANTSALEAALDSIMNEISQSGIANAEIVDGTTNKVASSTEIFELLEVDTTSFKYYKNGVEWTSEEDPAPPAATLDPATGKVTWDLKSIGLLENEVKYEVTFDVYPSQYTYDLIADLKNGKTQYSSLPSDIRKYLHDEGNNSYTLETNTVATLSYDDTRTDEKETPVTYDNPPAVATTADTISIEKEWDNELDGRTSRDVLVNLQRDGSDFYEASLSSANNWSLSNIYIATGLARLKNGVLTVLDTGHDYKFAELGSEAYYWELETETVHPMLINGVLTKLVLVENSNDIPSAMGSSNYYDDGTTQYYKLANGNTYKSAGTNASIKAINHRRSNLNIKKTVDGASSDPNQKFEFTIDVQQKDANDNLIQSKDTTNHNDYLWFSVQDKNGNTIPLDNVPDGWAKESETSHYYYAPNGTSLVVNLKDGDNLRFTNLVSNTDFTVVESNTNNYTLNSIVSNDDKKEINIDTKTINGKITENNKVYQVTYNNKYEKVNLSVEKIWEDDTNDGVKPETISVDLYADGQKVDGKTITLGNNGVWKDTETWKGLDRFANENEIDYTIQEVSGDYSSHYETTYSEENPLPAGYTKAFIITNTRKEDDISVDVKAKKVWDDANNQDGIRPTSVIFQLSDGTSIIEGKDIELDGVADQAGEGEYAAWEATFKNLPKYKNGQEIEYTIEEKKTDVLTGTDGPGTYSITKAGNFKSLITITNLHTPETTKVKVTKVWDDANNQDGFRPTTITINVMDGNTTVDTQTIRGSMTDQNWSFTSKELPKYKNGQVINYTVTEEFTTTPANKYVQGQPQGNITDGYTITNTHEPELIDLEVKKTWDDNSNQDGKRPKEITVHLLANDKEVDKATFAGTSDNWTYKFTDKPKYENGQEITYTVVEDAVEGYTTTENGLEITNTHTILKTSVCIKKEWDDNDDQDGYRPGSIFVNLFANNVFVKSQEVKINSENKWEYTFEDLDQYSNGSEITYTVTEDEVAEYSTDITGNQKDGYTITNSHKTEETEVTVTKVWDDNDDQDGYRPNDITVVLLADDKEAGNAKLSAGNNWTYTFEHLDKKAAGKDITYTIKEVKVDEYETAITGDQTTGYTITNTHETEETNVKVTKVWDDNDDQDGYRPDDITVVLLANNKEAGNAKLSAGNNWTYTFEHLAKKADGKDITYTIKEVKVDEYKTAITGSQAAGYTITNTHEIEKTNVSGEKVWEDANDQDGKRPAKITIVLLGNEEKVAEATISKDQDWKFNFEDLDKYADGQEIEYTVEEVKVTGYSSVITGNQVNGYTITNTHVPELIDLEVKKTWDDNSNQDGKRPKEITVHLLANDKEVDKATFTGTNDNWTYKFTNKPKYDGGKEITYTVVEDAVEGYTTTENGLEITNTHSILKTSVCIKKEWDDNDDQDGYRPGSIFVNLFANDVFVKSQEVKINSENKWEYTFEDLDQYSNGSEITYTVTEDEVAEYSTDITGNQKDGYTITNSHKTEETEVTVTKVWDDNDDQDGYRPNDITVVLLADDKEAGNAKLSAGNNWTYTFEHLDKKVAGKDITYTIKEVKVDEYETAITGDQTTGYIITNTHTPEKTEITAIKEWNEEKNTYGFDKPEKITVHLLANGEEIRSKDITEQDNWQYTFTDLDKFANKKPITYTITEDPIRDYDTDIVDNVITNTYNPETKDLEGTKTWEDNNDQDGERPTEITITLFGTINKGTENEKVVYTEEKVVEGSNEDEKWTYSFVNMPIYYNNQEIIWEVKENTVDGYETIESELNVTNTYYPEKVSYTVTKEWDDDDDNDHLRPTSITVRLFANGEEIDSVEISDENNWTYSFLDLPKFQNHGDPVEYTIKEDPVDEYEPEYEQISDYETIINNVHEKRTVSIHIVKTWNDNNDEYGLRPENIIVDIYRNNELYETITITAEDNWEYTISGLDEFLDGVPYEYTIKERPVEQYTTSYDKYNITNKVIEPEVDIEIIPPDTGVTTTENANYIYLLLTMISTLCLGLYKVFE